MRDNNDTKLTSVFKLYNKANSSLKFAGSYEDLIAAKTKDLQQHSSTHHMWSSLICLTVLTSWKPCDLGPDVILPSPVLVHEQPQ